MFFSVLPEVFLEINPFTHSVMLQVIPSVEGSNSRGDGEMGDGCRHCLQIFMMFKCAYMHACIPTYLHTYMPPAYLPRTYVRTYVGPFVDTHVHVRVILHSDWATLFAVGLILWD